jgi:hypothetical protein
MRRLLLCEEYSRQEVHGIFSPDTEFTPQAGTWGLHGNLPIPHRPQDYVFFVTFGQSQGEHAFDEGVSEDGILSWQSQPQQDLRDTRVQHWINHNELVNNIYLFLRTNPGRKYAYLGRLKYLDHDRERIRPVYFLWQIVEWPISAKRQEELGLRFRSASAASLDTPKSASPNPPDVDGLLEVHPPTAAAAFGEARSQFSSRKHIDYSAIEADDRKLGNAGELSVLKMERRRLVSIGRSDLADRVTHVSEIEGDGAGYDIRSFDCYGEVRFIEVKTTRGEISTPFFMSLNELHFAKLHVRHYALYRVFDFKMDTRSGSVFRIFRDISMVMKFEPVNFRVMI